VDADPRPLGVLRRRGLEGRASLRPVPLLIEEVGDVAGKDLLHLHDATELRLRYHYWPSPDDPLVFSGGESYADPDAPVQAQVEYAWQHSMGEIVTCLASAGLRIEYLHEHPWVPWKMFPLMVETEPASGVWRLPAPDDARLPLLYSLKATKA
jgi:hypothetical protein